MDKIPRRIQNLLSKYGNSFIISAEICRVPISSYIRKFLNVLTFGAAERKLKDARYDDLYHLYLILDIDAGKDGVHRVRIEKNQNLNVEIDKRADASEKRTCIGLERPQTTIKQLIDNAFKYQEDTLHSNLFVYDAFTNNCQVFIMSIVLGNGLKCSGCNSVKPITDFVMQDIRDFASSALQYGVRNVTDLAAYLARV